MDTVLKPTRNLSLECFKLLAACFVVFIHVGFPGTFGDMMLYLARFAVPLFFAVSGWFSYGVSFGKLKKRFLNILLLELVGDIIYASWNVLQNYLAGESLYWCMYYLIPDQMALRRWLVWNLDPIGGHLWYLSASCFCYFVMMLYTYLKQKDGEDYQFLYGFGFALLMCNFILGEFAKYIGVWVDLWVTRSGLFTGLPVFILGLFLRQHGQTLSRFGFPMLAVGVVLSILEGKIIGNYDLYVGSVLIATALLLLSERYPSVPKCLAKPASVFGSVSTTVYMLHLLVSFIYLKYFQNLTQTYLGELEPWLKPLLVLGVSLVMGFCWNALQKRIHKMK